jgi:uncharacterized OsmC-like protein
MLLEALVACAGVSVKAAAALLDIPLRSASVCAEGDVDLRGTLGVEHDVPVGFKEIRLRLDVDIDVSEEKRDELLNLVERYCVVLQTLQNSPKTNVRLNVVHQHAVLLPGMAA